MNYWDIEIPGWCPAGSVLPHGVINGHTNINGYTNSDAISFATTGSIKIGNS